MASYSAEVSWSRGEQKFVDNRYSRKHSMKFDGGTEVPGSSSPHVVPLPYSDATAVDLKRRSLRRYRVVTRCSSCRSRPPASFASTAIATTRSA